MSGTPRMSSHVMCIILWGACGSPPRNKCAKYFCLVQLFWYLFCYHFYFFLHFQMDRGEWKNLKELITLCLDLCPQVSPVFYLIFKDLLLLASSRQIVLDGDVVLEVSWVVVEIAFFTGRLLPLGAWSEVLERWDLREALATYEERVCS
jgi:hypothetical protein